MIIDTHVHIWEVPPVAPLGQTSPRPINLPSEPATAEELLKDMDAHDVDRAVLVQTSFSTWDNGYVADSARKYPDRFVSMGLINPQDPNNASSVRYWIEEREMVGFRLHPMYYDDEAVLTAERNYAMWDVIEETESVVQLHMFAKHAPQVATVAERHPSLRLVLDHLCYPQTCESPEFASHQKMLDLARFPNIFVKVSDVHGRSATGFPYTDMHPFIRKVQSAFGIERLMWGTGYPGRHREKYGWPTLTDELRLVHEGYNWVTESEKDRLLGGTAAVVWGFS